jgi:hypothetical protein
LHPFPFTPTPLLPLPSPCSMSSFLSSVNCSPCSSQQVPVSPFATVLTRTLPLSIQPLCIICLLSNPCSLFFILYMLFGRILFLAFWFLLSLSISLFFFVSISVGSGCAGSSSNVEVVQ